MYIDYSKLWKLLIDKNISKTELMELTGISSRVLAKLSKNQIVTTDTIARICTVLECDVGDIMECANEEKMSLFGYYQKYGKIIDENEFYKTIYFERQDKPYYVYVSKRTANKGTQIHCREDGAVYWEQLYLFGGMSRVSSEENVLIKPYANKEKIQIVLISGKPGAINGLDEGIFVSSRGKKRENCIYVMSETAFKLFEV